jgi:hypothetical protein
MTIPIPRGRRGQRECRVIDGQRCYECSTCFRWWPHDQFYRLSRRLQSACGLFSECIACANARRNRDRKRSRLRKMQALGLGVGPRLQNVNHEVADGGIAVNGNQLDPLAQGAPHVEGHADIIGLRRVACLSLPGLGHGVQQHTPEFTNSVDNRE